MELRDQIKLELLEIVNKGQINTTWLDQQSLLISSKAQIVRSGLHTDGCFNVIQKENGSYEHMIGALGIKELARLRQQRDDENREREIKEYQRQLAKYQARTHRWLFWIAVVGGGCGLVSLIVQLILKT